MDVKIPYEILSSEILTLSDRLKINKYLRMKAFGDKILMQSQKITKDDFLTFMSITHKSEYCVLLALYCEDLFDFETRSLTFEFQNKRDYELLASIDYRVDYRFDKIVSNISQQFSRSDDIFTETEKSNYHHVAADEHTQIFKLDCFSCFKIWLNKFLVGAISKDECKIALEVAKNVAIDYLDETLDDLASYENAYLQYSYLYLTCKMMKIDVVFVSHPKMRRKKSLVNLYEVEYGRGTTLLTLDGDWPKYDDEIEWRHSLYDVYQPEIDKLYISVVDFINNYDICYNLVFKVSRCLDNYLLG